jgi:hypothetical protein
VASQNDRFIQVQSVAGRRTDERPGFIWWKFVSTRQDCIEQTKSDWKVARFDMMPGGRDQVYPSLPKPPPPPMRYPDLQSIVSRVDHGGRAEVILMMLIQ